MKIIYLLMLTLLLASCGSTQNKDTENTVTDQAAIEDTTKQINEEINNLNADTETWVAIEESSSSTWDVVKLDATYSNQNWPVDMWITYSLSDAWIIESIEVTATVYDMTDYNKAAQVLVGKTLEDAKKFEVAWASLTNEAFKKAIK